MLLVVPDPTLAARLACQLDGLGHSVKVAPTSRSAEHFLDSWPVDAVVIDLATDGFVPDQVVEYGRISDGPATVLLREGAEPAERVRWLEAGASDFVPSPIWPAEVVARVEAVLRRRACTETQWTDVIGPLHLNASTGEVEVDGRRQMLAPMELKLLNHLARSPGTVFSRHDLLRDVWGYTTGGDATVTVHVRKLREKIELDSTRPRILQTRHGVGYYLSVDDAR